jgi:branched-chain amino acid transport system substrate-binding protein
MRRLLRRLLVALALLSATETARARTIRFGAVLPLTGPAAPIGMQQMRGIQFAADKANAAGGVHGDRIEILFEDSQANPGQAVRSFNRLADAQHVPVIFTAWSGPSLAMAPLATRRKILLVNAGAQADSLATASPYLVNTLPTIGDEIKVLSQYLTAEGRKRGVILFENDAAGIAGRDDYVKYFPQAGGTILAQEPWRFGKTDYRPALLKLADAKPDVMLVSITAGLLPMAQQYRQLGLGFTVAGTTFFADPGTIASPAAEGFVHTQVRIDAPPELAAEFKAKFGAEMEFFVRQYYNATQIVLTVADKVLADGKALTGETMHDTLFRIRRFQALIPLEFNGNTATVPLDIAIMQGGKDVTVKQIDPE